MIPALCLGTLVPRQKYLKLHVKWWSVISHGTTKGSQVSDQATPYRGVLPGLSIAHWKALEESYFLSHRTSSGGVV